MKRYGAVIEFTKNVTHEQAEQVLDELFKRGLIVGRFDPKEAYATRGPRAHDYDDRYGGPVWYIP